MKKVQILLLLIIIVIASNNGFGQNYIGISLTPTYSITNVHPNRQMLHYTKIRGKISNSFGIFWQNQFRPNWQFRTGLHIIGLGSRYSYNIKLSNGARSSFGYQGFHTYHWESDILYFVEKARFTPYFRAGVGLGHIERYTSSQMGSVIIDDSITFYLTRKPTQQKRKNILLNLGVGLALRVRTLNYIFAELAYQQGFFRIYEYDYETVLNTEISRLRQILRGSNIGLRIGYQKAILKNKS